MNKKLKIYPLLLFFFTGVMFCAEELQSKMEVDFPLRKNKRLLDLRTRGEEERIGKEKKRRLSLSQEEKNNQLVQAAKGGHLDEITSLLKASANPNARDEEGLTLLAIAKNWCDWGYFNKSDNYNEEVHLGRLKKYPQNEVL